MVEQVSFLLYTKETADAIKKASRLPPITESDSYYNPSPEQKLLPKSSLLPQQSEGGVLQLVKITAAPNGGSGAARGKIITVNADGTYTEGEEVSVICLALQ